MIAIIEAVILTVFIAIALSMAYMGGVYAERSDNCIARGGQMVAMECAIVTILEPK